jgi:Protein of unknown function (DUF4013)
MNDLGKAFSSYFKDPAWFTKTLGAALFMILSVFGVGILILAGYFVQIAQRVMRREDPVLPRWDGLGRKIAVGFKFCVVYLVYLIPVLLLLFPVFFILLLTGGGEETDTISIILSIYTFAVTLLLIPYGVFLSLVSPIILYRFAERERIGDAANFVHIVRLFGKDWQNTLAVALTGIGIQSIAPVGFMILGVGIFFTVFYSLVVTAHMSGLLGLNSLKQDQTP